MKDFVSDFFRRGLISCGSGPLVLAALYYIVNKTEGVEALSVNQVCTGIISLSLLAFVAGGMNAVYQLERLPVMVAILLHGVVLYFSYLATYLVNSWLEWGMFSVMVFSAAFVVGYFIIWVVIYSLTKRNTRRLNEMLYKKRQPPH